MRDRTSLLVLLVLLYAPHGTTQTTSCSTAIKSSSLTYAVDTTGSMGDDFTELKKVNSWLLDRVEAKFPCSTRQYTMVEFNDPGVGPIRTTQSKKEFGAFFSNLVATGGGDCPELSITGIQQALLSSPRQSFIFVLTDASAKDYSNTTLVNEVFSLIRTTQSQVVFLITGICGTEYTPDYTIYRDIASLSYGHVFKMSLSALNKVFYYLDYTLPKPVNSSELLFYGNFTNLVHTERFLVNGNYSSLMISTDGLINSSGLVGPSSTVLGLEVLVSESWGSVRLMKNPPKGNYSIDIIAGGVHAIRVQGFTATNMSSAATCSECHPYALCEKYADYVQCVCKNGFIGDGFNCSDIDECAYVWTHNCSVGTCQNTFGSYTCLCPSGYVNVGGSCVRNVCGDPSLNTCHPLAQCNNELYGYSCVCPNGYYGDGFHCEIDECQRVNNCSFGFECTKAPGSYSCSDPCVSRSVLNEPWRSTISPLSSTPNCDNSKKGWYQFNGSGGIHIPEYCVPAYRCNTNYPVWINGTHPVMKDGIVSRTACANWAGNCCSWTSTIQVKACPQGYYVYKLIGTPGSQCYASYCTDPNQCFPDEQSGIVNGVSGCYCNSSLNDTTAMGDAMPKDVNVECGMNQITVSYSKCYIELLGFNTSSLHLKNSSCTGVIQIRDKRYITVTTLPRSGYCGTELMVNSSYLTHTNVVYLSSKVTSLTFSKNISCTYPRSMENVLWFSASKLVRESHVSLGGSSSYAVRMAIFQDSNYTILYEDPGGWRNTSVPLYVGIGVEQENPSTAVLLMKSCRLTTISDTDTVNHNVISDYCPVLNDSTLHVEENGVSRQGRLSINMTGFARNYSKYSIDCQIVLCNTTLGTCSPVSGL